MKIDPKEYFTDPWNYIDLTQLFCSVNFITSLYLCAFFDHEIFPKHYLRKFAGYGSFLFWIKMFYWMRLFKATAHFITLIKQIISDSQIFTWMLFIAILAFANMFYVINGDATSEFLAGEADENFEYVANYSGWPLIDSVLAIFLILFGDFKYDDFSKGPDSAQ